MKFKFWVATLALILGAFPVSSMADNATAQSSASRNYGNLPLSFEPAQTPGRFLSRSGRYALSIGARESSIVVRDTQHQSTQMLRFALENSNPSAQLEALELLPGVNNYYRGRDERNWRIGVPTYGKLRAKNVYPGVDVVYYGDHRQLEFDFVVAPGADVRPIAISFAGMNKLQIVGGDLVAELEGQSIHFARPVAYQRIGGKDVPVRAEYSLLAADKAGLQIGAYDKSQELVIDPIISYLTYLGGAQADSATGIVVDATGQAFIAGQTCSSDFYVPAPNSSATTFKGINGACDAYVSKLNAAGTQVLYTTFIAGTIPEPDNAFARANGIAIDAGGRAYVAGITNFRDMPTLNPYNGGDSDAFITILNADGTLLRSAYLGGGNADAGYSIAVDRQQNVSTVGQTCSTDFPAYNGFQAKTEKCVAFITKLDFGLHIPPQGTGTSALSPRPPSLSDSCGILCPATPDATQTYYFFSAEFNGQLVPPEPTWPMGTYSYPGPTLYGTIPVPAGALTLGSFQDCTSGTYTVYVMMAESAGTANGLNFTCGTPTKNTAIPDKGGFNWRILGVWKVPVYASTEAYGVALDPIGDVFTVGGSNTESLEPYTQFLKTGAWIVKLRGDDGTLIYSTALGANPTDDSLVVNAARAVAVDNQGRAYVVGTATGGMKTTTGGANPAPLGGQDVFALRMNTAGSGVEYGTYLGGTGNEEGLAVTVDAGGWAYITGTTRSTDLPALNQLIDVNGVTMSQLRGQQDAYIARLSPDGASVIMSAYLGGSAIDSGNGIAVNSVGDIYVAGTTTSQDLPVNPPAIPASPIPGKTNYAGNGDAFVAMILGTSFPKVSLSVASVDFGSQVVGTTSGVAKTVKLQNVGNGSLAIKKIVATGDFTQTNNCGNQLTAAGGTKDNCTVNLTFSPTSLGTRSGELTFDDDAADSPQVIGLKGLGTLVQGTVAPLGLTFASLPVGQTSTSQSVTVTNTDTAASLTVSSVAVTGDFHISANGCSAAMAPGAAGCKIDVTFSPTASGIRTGTLVIAGNANVMPATIQLNGTGAQAATDFSFTGPTTPLKVNAGSSGSFTVAVAPLNGFNQHVNVTCAVTAPATCTVAPASLDAGTNSTAVVTVAVPAAGGSLPRGARNRRPFEPVLAFCIFGIALVGRKRQFWIAALVVVCCLALMFTGCGGGGGSSSGGSSSGMAPGTYSLTVTATYAGGTPALTHTMNVGLVVQ